MRINLKTSLLLLGVGSIVITVVVLIIVGIWQTSISSQKSIEQVNQLIDGDMDQISKDVYNLVQSQDESVQLQVANGMNVLEKVIQDYGGLTEAVEVVDWEAKNQLTNQVSKVSMPGLNLGSRLIQKETSISNPVPAVDELKSLMNARATIFQPLPDGSGILRIATNVVGTDGNRAIGTFIPAKNVDGSNNAVYTAVMSGKIYQGVAFVVDAWYVTQYHPIVNDKGSTIAVLFVGVKEESVASLRTAILNTNVGDTGYVTIIGGKGVQKGKYILSKGGSSDGKLVSEGLPESEQSVYQQLVDQAVTLTSGETVIFNTGSDSGEGRKILLVTYYAPWDWVIVVNGFQADYQSFFDNLKNANTEIVKMFSMFGLLLAVVGFIIIFLVATSISRPISILTGISKKLADGDMNHNISIIRNDEIGDLAAAFKQMIAYMDEMAKTADHISNGDLTIIVKTRGESDALGISFSRMIVNLKATITELQESAILLNEESVQLAEGAEQVNLATDQIASTIQEISHGASQQAESVNKSSITMENLERSVREVEKGSSEQANAVEEAAEKTSKISAAILKVEEHARSVRVQATEAASSASEGYRTVEETLNGMRQIQEKVKLSANKVDEMSARSNEIGKIVETIDDIASQTNLLALNAAIEAARAGESGKGFAVVADEVRKLAERSSHSTKEISDLVIRIQSTVTDAIKAMKESSTEVDRGVIKAEKAGTSLKNILQSADMVNQQAELAARASNEITESVNELVQTINLVAEIVGTNTDEVTVMTENTSVTHDAIENIASISQENSAAVEEVSASTEEVSAQVAEFRNSVIGLSKMARHLEVLAQQFKIS